MSYIYHSSEKSFQKHSGVCVCISINILQIHNADCDLYVWNKDSICKTNVENLNISIVSTESVTGKIEMRNKSVPRKLVSKEEYLNVNRNKSKLKLCHLNKSRPQNIKNSNQNLFQVKTKRLLFDAVELMCSFLNKITRMTIFHPN